MSSNHNEIISCLSDDNDDDDGNKSRASGSQKENFENGDNINPKVSLSASNGGSTSNDDDDDDIEVVDSKAYRAQHQAEASITQGTTAVAQSSAGGGGGGGTAANNNDNDEELEVVGTHNEQKLPHNRQDCLEFRYNAGISGNGRSSGINDNSKFCKLCFCYVCDKPAAECANWFRGKKGICHVAAAADGKTGSAEGKDGKAKNDGEKNSLAAQHNNHCDATDKGAQSQLWKNMRNSIKGGRDPSQVTNASEPLHRGLDGMQLFMANYVPPPNPFGPGGLSSAFTATGGASSRSRQRHRIHATARGGARQRRSYDDDDSILRGGSSSASNGGMYGSTTYAAAARSRSAGASARESGRRRNRPSSGSGNGSGKKRSAPHDHRARIRTQQMLEDLYN
eukprot:CAMPEP_0181119588 /NCGR_PEP_ID=MMETSP1071-20121207/23682_1 /TAXON_ID=35127 /ORGANISM="Thalassiosira sp., Strain NH16" /LENGTH=394 /DNA_ID=CAMNT_0023204145 /DNA_START=15 /DNA_END=1199 /DNA_ORIENTATION=-